VLATVLGTVAVAVAVVPVSRPAATVTLSVLVALAPLVGVARYRPEQRAPWLAVSAMLSLWATGLIMETIRADARLTSGFFIQAGNLVAACLVVHLFRRQRQRTPEVVARPTRLEALGHRADQAIVGCIVTLGAAQLLVTGLLGRMTPTTWAAVISPLDVVLACLLLRFVASRREMPPAGVLSISASLLTCLYDTSVTASGWRITTPHSPLNVLWVAGACLFITGALHPTMGEVFSPAMLRTRRTESARLLGLAPLALTPLALYAIGGTGPGVRLPVPVYLAVGAVVGILTIGRGAQALLGTERRAAQDVLTGAANRRGLGTAFDRLLLDAAADPAATTDAPLLGRLCLIDVDDFKHVNDTIGHAAGDQLLVEIADRLQRAVGPHGTVARSGGDEFVVLLSTGAVHPDQLLADVFGPPFPLVAGQARLSRHLRASAGWAPVEPGSELSQLLADVDVALYATKGSGKDGVTAFHPALREDVLGRLALVEDLRRLLAGEPGAGSLQPRFQPLVRLADEQVVGCESLVRWVHPTRGLLSPDTFLSLAEEHGLGARLDRWMLTASLTELARWDHLGLPPLFVSVNLGAASMLAPDLFDAVLDALTGCGVAPDRLHLEITEHAELPSGAGAAALRALADLGVRVSLDDFGTGYTSLDYVLRYPISTLKLDRSITEPLQREQTSALLRGVVLLARSLGLEVLAEGIETPLQQRRLLDLGAQLGQGYALARPLPAEEFVAHVRALHPPVPAPPCPVVDATR